MTADAPTLRVLVTGANGFIGALLCRRLQAEGYRVRVLLRRLQDGPWHKAVLGDLVADTLPDGLLDGVDILYNLAAVVHDISGSTHEGDLYRQVNVEGVRKLAEAGAKAGLKRFVQFSSIKAVSEGGDGWDEDHPAHPMTDYGKSKLAAERLLMEDKWSFEPVIIRPPMVFGNTTKGQLPRMIRAVRSGLFPPLPERGNRRSMIHVDDLVEATLLAGTHPAAAGRIYTVDDGQPYTPRQIHDWTREALGKAPYGWSIPMSVLQTLAIIGDGLERISGRRFPLNSEALGKLTEPAWFDNGRIRRELGFKPRRHLREALPEMMDYLDAP